MPSSGESSPSVRAASNARRPVSRVFAVLGVLAVALAPCVAAGETKTSAKAAKPASSKPRPTAATATAEKPRTPSKTTKTTAPRTAATSKRRTNASTAASRTWHTPTPGKSAPLDARGRPKLVLQGLNFPDRVELTAKTDGGGFSAEDLDRAAHVMREPSSGNEHPVAPRLLDVLYRIQTHFDAEELRIISGYRTPRRGKTSNHGKGRALDIVVPGARDEDVAKFAREMGFLGVGIYPTSGFVHVDVRERSFFWVDTSGPGRRNRTRGILGELARQSDAKAISRGEKPMSLFVIADDVDAVLGTTVASSHDDAHDDEDDDTDGEGDDGNGNDGNDAR